MNCLICNEDLLSKAHCKKCDIEFLYRRSDEMLLGAVLSATKSNWYNLIVSYHEQEVCVQDPFYNVVLESSFHKMTFKEIYAFVQKYDTLKNFL